MASLTLEGVTKVYKGVEEVTAVEDFSIDVEDGELLALVGPSGCGKSTTLRMIAGLETVTDGTISIGGREVQWMAPSHRSIAMVFQNYALYTNSTVAQNMAYGLKHSTSLSQAERDEHVREMAELLEIEDLLDDRPDELSGGQKQRVALGRALVRNPDVFLLDEPLSNLDAKLRARMRSEFQRIHREFGVTTVYVTHDQKEAMTMADRIAIMKDGRLHQVASPEVAYDHPTTEFVATFLGSPSMNVLDVAVDAGRTEYTFSWNGQTIARVPTESVNGLDTDAARVGCRPEHLNFHSSAEEGILIGEVLVVEYQGKENYVTVDIDGETLLSRRSAGFDPSPGDRVGVSVLPEHLYVFDPETGATLKSMGFSATQDLESPVDR